MIPAPAAAATRQQFNTAGSKAPATTARPESGNGCAGASSVLDLAIAQHRLVKPQHSAARDMFNAPNRHHHRPYHPMNVQPGDADDDQEPADNPDGSPIARGRCRAGPVPAWRRLPDPRMIQFQVRFSF
jgi:hypothetical protein